LEYTPVTDKGFVQLTKIASLSELHLDHTDITDAAVQGMAGLHNLKYIDVYHTSISEQGFNALQKALPACRINWSLDATRKERRT
jgi:hypothetical protein